MAESRFDDLVAALNVMASEQGVLGKLDTPGRILLGAVDEAEVTAASPEGIDEGFLLVLDRLARVVRNERLQFRSEMKGLTLSLSADVDALGAELASSAGRAKDFDATSNAISKRVETLVEQASERAAALSEQAAVRVQEEIGRVLDGPLVRLMFESLTATGPDVHPQPPGDGPDLDLLRSRMRQLKTVGTAVSEKLFAAARGPAGEAAQGFLRAGQVAGSTLHSVVYGIGKFVGYTFRPWGAVNIAKTIGNVGKVVGPLLAFAAIAVDVYAERQEQKREENLSRARREIEGQFRALSRNVEREFESNLRDKVEASVFDVADEAIATARSDFEVTSRASSDLQVRLRAARQDIKLLLASLRAPLQT